MQEYLKILLNFNLALDWFNKKRLLLFERYNETETCKQKLVRTECASVNLNFYVTILENSFDF